MKQFTCLFVGLKLKSFDPGSTLCLARIHITRGGRVFFAMIRWFCIYGLKSPTQVLLVGLALLPGLHHLRTFHLLAGHLKLVTLHLGHSELAAHASHYIISETMWDLFSVKTKIVVELIGVNIEKAVVHGLVQVDLQASPRERERQKGNTL